MVIGPLSMALRQKWRCLSLKSTEAISTSLKSSEDIKLALKRNQCQLLKFWWFSTLESHDVIFVQFSQESSTIVFLGWDKEWCDSPIIVLSDFEPVLQVSCVVFLCLASTVIRNFMLWKTNLIFVSQVTADIAMCFHHRYADTLAWNRVLTHF